ncbi:ParB N-terminal domain-containing protein [Desulfonatronospira sp.]|uniref:ParB N-terminal domain-containing protein n=1 Tax=Desulfonatronospira sp. TaxID=1962951 RepID=UPI0025C50EB4|nr:ParB N-terminal domain-containing protein [Desulfonatronospira sp.]
MLMYNQLTLEPGEILEVDPCVFWAEECGRVLLDSLRQHGQLQPLLVQKTAGGYSLLAGYKRFQGLKSLGRTLYALQADVAGPWEKGLIYLSSNLERTPDTTMMLQALRYFQPLGQDQEQVYVMMGITPDSRQQLQLQAWLELPHRWDTILEHSPQLLACAGELREMDTEDLDSLNPLFVELSWSLNKARKLLELLNRCSRAGKISPAWVISRLEMDRVLQKDLSPKDKIQTILNSLGREAYPEYTRLQEQARQNIRRLVAGTAWHCIHPDNFESSDLQLLVRVRTPEELDRASRQLSRIAGSDLLRPWPVYPYE